MAYNDDSVLARLSGLNESHDSIATAAQWIMFHRRHAERTVQLWMQRLKDSPSPKRLTLLYLANEVAQQSKIRHKDDFLIAFSPVIAEAVSAAYKGATSDVHAKLKRVIDVWRDRSVFEAPIMSAIDSRIQELDKAKGAPKPGFAGSPFSSTPSVPTEFTPLISSHQRVGKLSGPLEATVTSANQEYEKQTDPNTPVPSAPVYAARLNGLLKTLANAESAVAECVKAREDLVSGLEKLLDANRSALARDQETTAELRKRKAEIEEKKQQVEIAIMRALGPTEDRRASGEGGSASPHPEPDRPEMEALTPPPMESFTPPPAPAEPFIEDDGMDEKPSISEIDTTSRLASSYQSLPISTNGSNKRRRVEDSGDFPDLGGDDGIDADVAEMLKQEDKEGQ